MVSVRSRLVSRWFAPLELTRLVYSLLDLGAMARFLRNIFQRDYMKYKIKASWLSGCDFDDPQPDSHFGFRSLSCLTTGVDPVHSEARKPGKGSPHPLRSPQLPEDSPPSNEPKLHDQRKPVVELCSLVQSLVISTPNRAIASLYRDNTPSKLLRAENTRSIS